MTTGCGRTCRHLLATLAAATVAVTLANCGGSSGQTQAAVNACLANSEATRTACQCAVTRANAAGVNPATLIREMNDGTAVNNQRIVTAALSCYGR